MTDLYEHTDRPEGAVGSDDAGLADGGSIDTAGPTTIQFVPIEGERLEHLATKRRGPLRWVASLVLSVQAERGRAATATAESPPTAPPETMEDGAKAMEDGAKATAAAEETHVPVAPPRAPEAAPVVPAPIAPEPVAVVRVNPPPPVSEAPTTGSVWTAEDEASWEAWEATGTKGDTDRRLASMGDDLDRPLPAPLRLAQRLSSRRHAAADDPIGGP